MSSVPASRHIASSPFRNAKRAADGTLVLRFRLSDKVRGKIIRLGTIQPARAVKPGWQQRPTTTLVVPKALGSVQAESGLEADAYRAFALDPKIRSFQVQPFRIEYEEDGRVISTYPDIELRHVDGTYEIVQIKSFATYQKHLEKNPRFRAEGKILKHFGWKYRVLTELEIRTEPFNANTRLLWHYHNRSVTADLRKAIITTVLKAKSMTVEALKKAMTKHGIHEADVYGLIAQGYLRADPATTIGPRARVIAVT